MVLISPVQARRRHAQAESVSAALARPVIASMVFPGLCLEHFPEKWAPVFRRKCDQRNESRA
jgi:hypothetical protein